VRTKVFAALVAGLGLAASAEAASRPGFTLTGHTAQATYYSRGSARADVRRIEAFVTRLQTQLDAPAAASQYYTYDSPEQIAAVTGHHAAGVTFGRRREVHSTQPFHRHELVHLVAAELGDPGRFFQEGLAVVLGDERRWQGRPVDSIARSHAVAGTVSALVADFDGAHPDVAYPVAGSFVAWLIDTHGIDRVRGLFRVSGAQGAAAFEIAFGAPLDAAAREWSRSL
jgi:hypothetical protein